VSDSTRHKVAGPEVVSDVIDGEVVIVNLETGDYYTLNPTGSLIWELVVKGYPRVTIRAQVAARYRGSAEDICEGVDLFLDRLANERLIVSDGHGSEQSLAALESATEVAPFARPVIIKYTDMEDLLTLDPVHEVDEFGWPGAKPVDP